MIKVCPAILATDLAQYRVQLAIVRQLTDRFQLDIIDGQFVDNKTVQPEAIGKIGSELKLDVHLMVADPLVYIEQMQKLRPNLVIVQYESAGDVVGALARLNKIGIKAGVALNPETPLDVLTELLPTLSHVLLMAYPAGFAGQKFETKVLERIEAVRALNNDIEIGLDGGVDGDTIASIAKTSVDVVNVNSYLFGAEDPLSQYSKLLEAVL